jgi:hypothetical protein
VSKPTFVADCGRCGRERAWRSGGPFGVRRPRDARPAVAPAVTSRSLTLVSMVKAECGTPRPRPRAGSSHAGSSPAGSPAGSGPRAGWRRATWRSRARGSTRLRWWLVTANEGAAEHENQRLVLAADGACPVDADEERLRETVDNLVNNAIEYAPKGSTIDVGVARRDGAVRLWVRDQGPGLSAGPPAAVPEVSGCRRVPPAGRAPRGWGSRS